MGLGALFGEGGSAGGFLAPGKQKEKADPGADGGIGNIKGGETDFATVALLEVKIEKIDDVLAKETVDQIADNATEDKADGNLAQPLAGIKMIAVDEKDQERDQRDNREEIIISMKHAPGGAGVLPMNKLEKAVDHDPL